MKTAIIYGPRDLRVEEVEAPSIGPEDALVHVRTCGICGSDVHRYLGTCYGQRFRYPLNSGHEYCGDVVQVGENVRRINVGDKVVLGVDWVNGGPGAFSEYVRIIYADERLHKVPEKITYEEASLIEPLLVALNGFSKPKPKGRESVLILGAGPIGLCLLQLCRNECSGEIIVSEISPKRLELAKHLGATAVDVTKESLEERVKALTNGEGVDVTFECAGALDTLRQAFSLTRQGGRICLIAHYSQSAEIDPEVIVGRSMTVHGPEYGGIFFNEAIRLILEGKVKLKPLVSHQLPLQKAREAFDTAANARLSVKVLVRT
ncbi:MAG: zinc-binding dehydrogenase [Candidatus Bathyarchaeota archaeon]|nr:zinc-binding dehydrogenase [Candidatus Bathyarchaeota archaeon]MDH5687202.1 zinc-binding dehydrogenase [Candidatus Bathyarchaeota archaeon]